MKERGSSSVVFWAAAVLAGLAWTGARADFEDKNAAREALKAAATSLKPPPPAPVPAAVETARKPKLAQAGPARAEGQIDACLVTLDLTPETPKASCLPDASPLRPKAP